MKAKFLILLVFPLLSSCKEAVIVPDVEPTEVFPLKMGNRWDFTRTYWDMSGNPTQVAAEYLRVFADTVLFGQRGSIVWLYAADQFFTNSYEGVTTRWIAIDDQAHVIYKYPARVGDTYGYPIPTFGQVLFMDDTSWIATVIAVDTLITVPAGSFHCIAYRVSPDVYWFYRLYFISVGDGWIKEETWARDRPTNSMVRTNSLELTNLTKK